MTWLLIAYFATFSTQGGVSIAQLGAYATQEQCEAAWVRIEKLGTFVKREHICIESSAQ